MTGVEIDFVVPDSLQALAWYEGVFVDVQRIEVTALDRGRNEAVFQLFGTRMHMLDENPAYQLIAPKPDDPKNMWCNVLVEDIEAVWTRAMDGGATQIQPPTNMPDMGAWNAMFVDPYGYVWMMHQIERVVSFEERSAALEKAMRADAEATQTEG